MKTLTVSNITEAVKTLRQARFDLCMDSEQVAGLIGCSGRAVYYWETRQRTPSMENIIKWARVLGYSRIVIEISDPIKEVKRYGRF